jgi:hypothetical protein
MGAWVHEGWAALAKPEPASELDAAPGLREALCLVTMRPVPRVAEAAVVTGG